MANTNPLKATFFAFRKREKGGVLFGASMAYLILALIVGGGFLALNWSALGEIMTWYGQLITAQMQGKLSPQDMSAMAPPPAGLATFALLIFPFLFIFYVLLASYEAACQRWMIRGQTGGFMGLTLGGDTWRVYSVYWIWFLLYMGVSIAFGILTLIVGGAAAMSGQVAATPAVALITVVRLIFMLFFAVRLAPAAAISVGLKKFSFFKAWQVTSGRFWALFGSYLVLCLLALAGEIVFAGVLIAAIGGSALMTLGAHPDPQQVVAVLASMLTPQNLIILCAAYAIFVALSMILYVLFFGISARAVIAAAEDGKIEGLTPDTLAQTFD